MASAVIGANNLSSEFTEESKLDTKMSPTNEANKRISKGNKKSQEVKFQPLNGINAKGSSNGQSFKQEYRSIAVPAHRYSSLKKQWIEIYTPIIEKLKLQIRMNIKTKNVELRTSKETEDIGMIDRAAQFVRACLIGFEIPDAEALLRMEDIYIESFNVDDVKTLHGEHLSRAIGRVAGKDGKTKFAIENSTRTRMVLADKHISLLGSYQNIRIARDAICDLILGAPPGKIYFRLRAISTRLKERF